MALIRVCSESEIEDNSLCRFVVEGKDILLAKYEGKVYALDEKCTHREGPLSEGTLEDGVIVCPWHFGQFDLVTEKVRGPPPAEPSRSYQIQLEGAVIFISLV